MSIICWISLLTLCILVDFPRHVDRTSMDLSILQFKGSHVDFLNSNISLSLKIVCILIANSADPDEMPHNVAFHLWVFTVC